MAPASGRAYCVSRRRARVVISHKISLLVVLLACLLLLFVG